MDFKYDSNGDLYISSDGLLHLEDRKERLTKSRLDILLNTNKEEWEFNTAFGVPWITNALNSQIMGKVDSPYIEATLINEISTIPEIVEVTNFNIDVNHPERISAITMDIKINSGEILRYQTEV